MKKVLIIAYVFPPLNIAGTFRPMRFVKYLPKFGWLPSVITVQGRDDIPRDVFLSSEIPDDINVHHIKAMGPVTLRILNEKEHVSRQDKSLSRSFLGRVKLKLLNLFNSTISIPDPLIYWVPPVIWKAYQLYQQGDHYDAIITTSPPHSSHFAGVILSRILHVPWICDFRDPWVDNVYFAKLKGSVRRVLEGWLERFILLNADAIIANTQTNKETLLCRYGTELNHKRIVTITNGFDQKYIDSIISLSLDRFTICHTGRFYSVLEPYFFFDCFARWLKVHRQREGLRESVQVLVIGSKDNDLRHNIAKLGLEDCVRFVPRLSHREALSYAKSADLLLVNIGFKHKAKGWIPLKLYDYLGCGRPIIGILPKDGDASEVIRSTKSGFVISRPDYQAVESILDEYYAMFKNKSSSSTFFQDEVEKNKYEINTLTKRLAMLLDSAIK